MHFVKQNYTENKNLNYVIEETSKLKNIYIRTTIFSNNATMKQNIFYILEPEFIMYLNEQLNCNL